MKQASKIALGGGCGVLALALILGGFAIYNAINAETPKPMVSAIASPTATDAYAKDSDALEASLLAHVPGIIEVETAKVRNEELTLALVFGDEVGLSADVLKAVSTQVLAMPKIKTVAFSAATQTGDSLDPKSALDAMLTPEGYIAEAGKPVVLTLEQLEAIVAWEAPIIEEAPAPAPEAPGQAPAPNAPPAHQPKAGAAKPAPNSNPAPNTKPAPLAAEPPAPAPAPPAPPAPPAQPDLNSSSEAGAVLGQVNARRTGGGLNALSLNGKLMQAAQVQANYQAANGVMTHDGNGGLAGRLAAQGYSYCAASENVAAGQRSGGEAFNSWVNSSGHLANIMQPGINEMGLAVVRGANGTLYWAQVFGASC